MMLPRSMLYGPMVALKGFREMIQNNTTNIIFNRTSLTYRVIPTPYPSTIPNIDLEFAQTLK